MAICIFLPFYHGDLSADNCKSAFGRNFQRGEFNENDRFITTQSLGGAGTAVPIIGRILNKAGDDKILIETVDTSSGQLTTSEVEIRQLKGSDAYSYFVKTDLIMQGNPEQLRPSFEILKSEREKVDSHSLRIPETREEEELLARRFNPLFTKGLDKTNQAIAMGKKLRELGVNPYKTHIEPFADQIQPHIEHIRKGININSTEGREQMKALEALERQAEEAVHNGAVTYKWWIRFNYALSTIFSAERGILTDKQRDYIDSFLPHFPTNILMPTTSELGIMAINRAGPEGILVVELTNTENTVHNERMSPSEFFLHDMEHAGATITQNNVAADIPQKAFHDRFIREIKGYPNKERENVELAHFILVHEFGNNSMTSPPYERGDLKRLFMGISQVEKDLLAFRQFSSFKETMIMVEDFMRVYSEVRDSFNTNSDQIEFVQVQLSDEEAEEIQRSIRESLDKILEQHTPVPFEF